MSMSVTKRLVLGTTAGAIVMMMGALAPASAKGKHHRHFHRFHAPIVVSSGYVGCNYFYQKWKRTGSQLWRSKYIACIS